MKIKIKIRGGEDVADYFYPWMGILEANDGRKKLFYIKVYFVMKKKL